MPIGDEFGLFVISKQAERTIVGDADVTQSMNSLGSLMLAFLKLRIFEVDMQMPKVPYCLLRDIECYGKQFATRESTSLPWFWFTGLGADLS
ncbi:hypothetical protein GCM10023346_14070 [Arthrobacter gyeryongensis]|uniref:Uncharacterized protein n=1 Tax=Arthrobacter gyeryongensis TaxID=1650592 RepID=A0ABP9S8W9_9MICC